MSKRLPPLKCPMCETAKYTEDYTRIQWEHRGMCRSCQKAHPSPRAPRRQKLQYKETPGDRESLPPLDSRQLDGMARLAAAVLADSVNIITGKTPPKTVEVFLDPKWERNWWESDGPQVWLEACGIATSMDEARERVRRL